MARGTDSSSRASLPPARVEGASRLGEDAPERIDAGPSMQNRARLMVAFAFLLAMPATLLGALRASQAAADVDLFSEAQLIANESRQLQLRAQRARAALWRYEADAGVDSARNLKTLLDDLSRASLGLEERLLQAYRTEALRVELASWQDGASGEPLLESEAPLRRLRGAVGRVRRAVDPIVQRELRRDDEAGETGEGAIRRAHTALEAVTRDAAALADSAQGFTERRMQHADDSVSVVGRDQIVLFLLLLFTFPLFIALGPGWMIAPLSYLRGLAQRIERGKQARDPVAQGNDEIAAVTRALRAALRRLEETDKKQKHKIFEMGRLLRAIIAPLQDAVLVVNPNQKIAYANAAAASLLGRETHHLESCPVDEACWSAQLQDALSRARSGDIDDQGLDVSMEMLDGRVMQIHVQLATVRDQAGEIARVVVVMRR